LRLALVHRSWCAESTGEESNERLEFLGDSVLGLVVTAHLYDTHPDLPEGDLARIRAAVVSTESLAPVAAALELGEALYLGRGEELSGGRSKPSLLADCFEAVIGALYLSGGLAAAEVFVLRHLTDQLDEEAARDELGDAKNVLQELAASSGLAAPTYRLRGRGPDHARIFSADVALGEITGHGEGNSKKQAERAAVVDVLGQHAAVRAASDE
jgi:ribonuclease III